MPIIIKKYFLESKKNFKILLSFESHKNLQVDNIDENFEKFSYQKFANHHKICHFLKKVFSNYFLELV